MTSNCFGCFSLIAFIDFHGLPDGVFSLVTGLRKVWTTEESCFDSLFAKESFAFSKTSRPALGSTRPSAGWVPGLSLRGKVAVAWSGPLAIAVEVKIEWIYTSNFLYAFMVSTRTASLYFPFHVCQERVQLFCLLEYSWWWCTSLLNALPSFFRGWNSVMFATFDMKSIFMLIVMRTSDLM